MHTVSSLVMSGSMSCRAYVHQKATVREAIQVCCRSFICRLVNKKLSIPFKGLLRRMVSMPRAVRDDFAHL